MPTLSNILSTTSVVASRLRHRQQTSSLQNQMAMREVNVHIGKKATQLSDDFDKFREACKARIADPACTATEKLDIKAEMESWLSRIQTENSKIALSWHQAQIKILEEMHGFLKQGVTTVASAIARVTASMEKLVVDTGISNLDDDDLVTVMEGDKTSGDQFSELRLELNDFQAKEKAWLDGQVDIRKREQENTSTTDTVEKRSGLESHYRDFVLATLASDEEYFDPNDAVVPYEMVIEGVRVFYKTAEVGRGALQINPTELNCQMTEVTVPTSEKIFSISGRRITKISRPIHGGNDFEVMFEFVALDEGVILYTTATRQITLRFASERIRERVYEALSSLLIANRPIIPCRDPLPSLIGPLPVNSFKVPVFVGTWNVGSAEPSDLTPWTEKTLKDLKLKNMNWTHKVIHKDFSDTQGAFSLLAFGGQEAEFKQKSASDCQEHWITSLQTALGPGYLLVAAHSLLEMRLAVFCANRVIPCITNVKADNVATGIGNFVGNKGGVCISFQFFETTVAFITSHLAAHQTKVETRNNDYRQILSNLGNSQTAADIEHSFDHVFWCGDLNYRINTDVDTCREKIDEKDWAFLYEHDQLHIERDINENCFVGYEEQPIDFPPTYRYHRGSRAYTEVPVRVPSWCDRVMVRSLPGVKDLLHPVAYRCHDDIMTSDHSPVSAQYELDIIVSPSPGESDESQAVIFALGNVALTLNDDVKLSAPWRLKLQFISKFIEGSPLSHGTDGLTWLNSRIPQLKSFVNHPNYLAFRHISVIVKDTKNFQNVGMCVLPMGQELDKVVNLSLPVRRSGTVVAYLNLDLLMSFVTDVVADEDSHSVPRKNLGTRLYQGLRQTIDPKGKGAHSRKGRASHKTGEPRNADKSESSVQCSSATEIVENKASTPSLSVTGANVEGERLALKPLLGADLLFTRNTSHKNEEGGASVTATEEADPILAHRGADEVHSHRRRIIRTLLRPRKKTPKVESSDKELFGLLDDSSVRKVTSYTNAPENDDTKGPATLQRKSDESKGDAKVARYKTELADRRQREQVLDKLLDAQLASGDAEE
eukprot:TRINITY_DN420_c6_g1_i1.p1 TRINITY_DN420_c6_g1~~TRINITY_DN420_c6_g1_i1.p1  ORF type:complete len:1210 (+),score=194.17 TRINITY_DN420_c6_g1_i1:468-3632(+)